MNAFTGGFSDIVNCLYMRKVFELLETGLCFGPRKHFYYLFVFIALINATMLVLNFTMYCALGSSGNKVGKDDFNLQMGKKENK